MEQYVLENRWIINGNTLRYFGIRKTPYTNKNTVKLSNKEINAVNAFICGSQEIKGKLISRLIDEGILVRASEKRVTPKSIDDACFCKNCVANDFIIPGIEFVDGLCPMCISAKQNSGLIATLPIKQTFEKSKTSRYDIALFYTGGKDSTYLLLYFTKVLNLRVLALTWEIPFMSESARKSIENAKKKFRNVEFVNRYVAPNDLAKMYKKLLELQNNICACPSLAYVLFFPTLVAERVPYLVLGNEPVQMLGLYYNNMAPKITYRFKDMKTIHTLMNIGRLFQLKNLLKKVSLKCSC